MIILRSFTKTSSLARWSAAMALQLPEKEAACRLIRLREGGYLVVRGRGRGASYDLRRDLADRLRGRATVDSDLPLEKEAVNLRILALLRARSRLTNSEIGAFFSTQSGTTSLSRLHLPTEVEIVD